MSIAFTFKVGNVAFCNLHIAFCDTQLKILFCHLFFVNLKSATIIQYTIKGRFMSR